jgi:CRP-like cAMP-binding protein
MIWQQLSTEDKISLLSVGKNYKVERGHNIYGNHPAKHMYFLLDGLVGIYMIPNGGAMAMHSTNSVGEFFPAGLLLGKQRRSSAAIAETDVELLRLEFADFMNFFRRDVSLMELLAKEIAGYYLNYSYHVSGLQLRFARDRMIYRLLYITSLYPLDSKQRVVIPRLTRTAIAESSNVSKEKVSREMSRLVNRGFIEYAPKKIIIKDVEALRKQLGKDIDVPRPKDD